jgi:hypothetical protein
LFEDSTSRPVQACLLAFVNIHLLLFFIQLWWSIEPPSCPDPSRKHDVQQAQIAFSCLMVAACGFATVRNPGRRFALLMAWLCTIIYIGLFVTSDLAPCLHWLRTDGRIENVSADIATVVSLVDVVLLFMLVCFLAVATATAPAPSRDVRTITAGSNFVQHCLRMLQAVPLKHTVAALEGLVAVVSLTIGLCVAAYLVRPVLSKHFSSLISNWEQYLDQLDALVPVLPPLPPLPSSESLPDVQSWLPSLINHLRSLGETVLKTVQLTTDSLLHCVAPASILSLCLLVVYLKHSFDLIWQDHERLCNRHPLACGSNTCRTPQREPPDGEGYSQLEEPEGSYVPPVIPAMEVDLPLPEGVVEQPASPSQVELSSPTCPPAAVAMPIAALPSAHPERIHAGRFCSDGALDIKGLSFQYLVSYMYIPTLIATCIFTYCAMMLLFLSLFFCFRMPTIRRWAYTTLLFIPLLRVVARKLSNLLLGCCVVRNSTVFAPRLLSWLDLVATVTWTWFIGPGTACARFVLGCVHLLGRLVCFQVAVAPRTLSFLDPAYGAYGAVMKGRYWRAVEEGPPSGSSSLWLQPGTWSF